MVAKLQQKALQQPKQKKSKSAEFLMGEKERAAVEGIENPAFDGGGSGEPSIALVWPGREIGGDRPDSTLAAHQKKLELQAPAKERGNEHARNYFDPSSAEQTDPRHRRMSRVNTEDELELTMLNADEKRLYQRMAELLDEDTFIDLPGTLLAPGDEEVLEVKAGDPVPQRWLLLHSGDGASGPGPTQADTIAKTQGGASASAGLEVMSTVKNNDVYVKMRTVEEVISRYAQQLRERVRPDMITLGSLSLQQVRATKRTICSLSPRVLGEGQEEVMAKHGQMTELPEYSSSVSQPLWQVSRSKAPQPVKVCVRCLRAVRDKLPRGLYSVRVTVHSCLGGPALAWPSMKEKQQWARTTEPVEHRGRFYDTDLHMNQSLLMTLPPPYEALPSMVLLFQLIALPGDTSHISSVLAWGAYPVCDTSLCPVQGRFKTPLLRGKPSPQLDQFRKIEDFISTDLDHWLCNLYFQIRRLPFGSSRVSEHSVSPPIAPPHPPFVPTSPEVHHGPLSLARPQPQPSLQAQPRCQSPIQSYSHFQPHPQLQPHAGPKSKVVHSHRGSPLHLSADFACSSSSLQVPGRPGSCSPPLVDRTRWALRMLPSELGLPLPWQQRQHSNWHSSIRQLGLIMLLLALMWFVRLYLHYCSQWLYLQAMAVPVNKFQFHAHTVDLVYQNSLLHTREELAMVVVGPLTLNGVTFLLVLIRWGCQQIFGSLPSFTSKFIMVQGVWTVLDPLAVFAVDAILGRLSYSADIPVGDAAKLYWHFYRSDQSGAMGVVITLFLYTVLFLLSITILSIYLLRFHNDGRMLDIFQRLTAKEGTYFLPQDLELSNQELSYIVKKAEQWRGFNGERRKVAVYDYIWTEEDPLVGSAPHNICPPGVGVPTQGAEREVYTHVAVHTLYLSGLQQRYRHFLRHPDGAIVEPGEGSSNDVEGGFKVGEKNGVIDGVKCCRGVEEGENAEVASG
ncbi:uncharacterized protein ofcc1 [Lampris incognitus]|uniref:uncharacterized protein ofcc1 n=1 Tax=Lampris incognitus TaxID=2546036 RepID=UPI0024B4D0A3|nr:uncharacterized protein ofcc1 [Lampris incognitus]